MFLGKPSLRMQAGARPPNGKLLSCCFAVVALAACFCMSPSRILASDEKERKERFSR